MKELLTYKQNTLTHFNTLFKRGAFVVCSVFTLTRLSPAVDDCQLSTTKLTVSKLGEEKKHSWTS